MIRKEFVESSLPQGLTGIPTNANRQWFGFGIQLVRKDLAKDGNPEPEFEVNPQAVVCRVKRGGGS